MTRITKYFQALFYTLFLLPGLSSAQSLFTPSEGDLSVEMISKLFGSLTGKGGSDPLLDLITAFNSSILAIGALLVTYTIFAETINTANEGKFLARFNGAWVPLRTAIGAALVIPINGYCVMQYIVMWLVMQGIGLADMTWSAIVKGNAIQTSVVKHSYNNSDNITKLANNLFVASVCLVAAEKNNQFIMGIPSYWTVTSGQGGTQFNYGHPVNKDFCGKLTMPKVNVENGKVKYSGKFDGVNGTMSIEDSNKINQAHINATKVLQARMMAYARAYVDVKTLNEQSLLIDKPSALPANFIAQSVNEYTKTVGAEIESAYSNVKQSQRFAQSAEKEGWIMAGAWFMKIANEMTQLSAQMNNTASMSVIANSNREFSDEINKLLDRAREKLKEDSANEQLGISANNDMETNKVDDGLFHKIAVLIGKAMTGIALEDIASQPNAHPIIQAKAMGDQMITASFTVIGTITAMIGAGITVGAASAWIPFIGDSAATVVQGMTSMVVFVTPFVFLFIGGTLSMGWLLSYFIPMMPFVIWLGALIGWFILVVQAVIAAPLWAVMHLHPNGDDVTGKGGQGYMLVLGLLVRPTLMIFGLSSAIILSMVLGEFLNTLFFEVFQMSRNGEQMSVFATIFAYVIYVSVFLSFIRKMFDMIHIIPDQLLEWIGGGSSQLGSYAGDMLKGSEGQFMAAGAVIGATANQATTKATKGLADTLSSYQRDKDRAKGEFQGVASRTGVSQEQGASMLGKSKLSGINDFRQAAKATEGMLNGMNGAKLSDTDRPKYEHAYQQSMNDLATNEPDMPLEDRINQSQTAALGATLDNKYNRDGLTMKPSEMMSFVANGDKAMQNAFASKMNDMYKGAMDSSGGNKSEGMTKFNEALRGLSGAFSSLKSGANSPAGLNSQGVASGIASGFKSGGAGILYQDMQTKDESFKAAGTESILERGLTNISQPLEAFNAPGGNTPENRQAVESGFRDVAMKTMNLTAITLANQLTSKPKAQDLNSITDNQNKPN